MEINTYTDNVIGETGIVDNITHNSQTILLDHNYNNPVVFAQPLSYNSSHAAIVRIEDIQGDRFTASIQEPSNLNGYHPKESFSYLVLERGTWQLEDDTLLEVGTLDTNLLSSKGWKNVDFTNDFADDPLVFSQVQTDNGRDLVHTRQRNTDSSGFQITMQEEEALNNSGHAKETVGWFAIDAGNGNWSQNNYLAGQTGNRIDHNWSTIDFEDSFTQSPIFLASIATYNGGDPSGLRHSDLDNNQVNIKIEEDTSKDAEISHAAEVVNFLAIGGESSLRGVPLGEKLSEENSSISKENWDVIYDGLNQNQPLKIVGMENVLIRNSTFNNVNSGDAIYIRESSNVRIENVTINNTVNNDAIDIRYSDDVHIDNVVIDKVSGGNNLNGVGMWQSTDIIVEDSKFSRIFSSGQSAGIKIAPGKLSANITIDNNHIHNTYGNGIVSDGSSQPKNLYVHDNPVPGLKIINNLIHDTGLTSSPASNSPTHGMYIKAQDPYIANNTIYNSFDGTGISIRSTAVVKNNKIWNTTGTALAFNQMKPAGSSRKSVIENNELFFNKERPKSGNQPLLKFYWDKERFPIFYDNFEVRNNKLSICDDITGEPPLIFIGEFANVDFTDNNLVDHREKTKFFSYNYSIRDEDKNLNFFNESSCSQ
ncbi:MAG: right-handed parallel beta-helix repeat-containing protein [Cyanobacteria bacterium P01_G01_bin.39]